MVQDYVESQWPDDPVVHIEKVAVERVADAVHTLWDVHCRDSRWWVVDNPTNVYAHEDFKSASVVLTFTWAQWRESPPRTKCPST